MKEVEEMANLFELGIKGYNRMNGVICGIGGVAQTVRANSGGHNEVKIAEPCIAAMRGREPSVLTPKRTEYGKADRKAYESGEHKESRHTMQQLEPREDGITNTLTTVQKDNLVVEPHYRIRKLTPKECWRLMDFTDEDFDKAKAALNRTFYNGRDRSNSQLYKQAGNSIVVACLQRIFGRMKGEEEWT